MPAQKFREDLVAQLTRWQNDGERLIVCLDANEHIYKKSIGKALTDIEGLAMKEVVGDFTGTPIGSTFFRSSKPIDGVWATSNITVINAAIMPAGYGIGDHRLFMINFSMMDTISKSPPRIVRPASRRLNTKISRVAAEYAWILEKKILKHRLIERMGTTHTSSKSGRKVAKCLNRLDNELGQYMRHAEKKCRKIKSGMIPFLPVDTQDSSVLVSPQIPCQKDPQQRKPQADGVQMQYSQCNKPNYMRNQDASENMCHPM
jgi:hypothetical protein